MFQTIRKTFFWPRIAEDVNKTVRQCDLCIRNRISEKMKTNPLKLLPANGPQESVAMDILGPLPRDETRKPLSLGDQRPLLQGYQDGPPANSYRLFGRPSILRPLRLRVRTACLSPDR
jgi:Integrase zinc binding domain